MKIIEMIHNATDRRTFICEHKYTDSIHVTMHDVNALAGRVDPLEAKFMKAVSELPLVNNVYMGKREITVEIQRGFEHSEDDWAIIRHGVLKEIADFFGVTSLALEYSVQDRTTKAMNKREEEEYEPQHRQVITLFGLQKLLQTVTISHNFRTHHETWRKALEIALWNANAGIPNVDNMEADVDFWEHEIEAFDKAMKELLALNLPEDN
jgi:hypothetical protein